MTDHAALADKIARLAAHINAAEYQLIKLIGEFDESGGWAEQGAVTCAAWLSWRIGLGLAAAREKVRVAAALRGLPLVAKEFEQGRMSYSKVRAVTRVGTPENDALLVDMAASAPASVLETKCRKFRSVVKNKEREETQEEAEGKRLFTVTHLENGMVRISQTLPADEAARYISAVDQARLAPATPDDVSAETPATRKGRVDGLMIVVDSFLAEGPKTRTGGAPHEVCLHVGLEALREKKEGAFISNEAGTGVSAETARRLSCDAGVVRIVEDKRGNVLDVGRRTRTVSGPLRRAMLEQFKHRCAFPGCTHTLFLEGHHRKHWADGGETKLDNVIPLCSRHHTFVHEYGYRIEVDANGDVQFISPENKTLPRVWKPEAVPADAVRALAEEHAERGLALTELSLLPPHWNGESESDFWTINALCEATFKERKAA